MASSIGPAQSRHATVRPFLLRVMRPAPARTSRCFITAGKDMANGSASSLTDSSVSDKRASSARRVGSDNAAKVRSSNASLNLTMRLSLETNSGMSRTGTQFLRSTQKTSARAEQKETRHVADQTLRRAASGGTTDYGPDRGTPEYSAVLALQQMTRRAAAAPRRPERVRSPIRRDRTRPAQSQSPPCPRSACGTRRSPRGRSRALRNRA